MCSVKTAWLPLAWLARFFPSIVPKDRGAMEGYCKAQMIFVGSFNQLIDAQFRTVWHWLAVMVTVTSVWNLADCLGFGLYDFSILLGKSWGGNEGDLRGYDIQLLIIIRG